jgi:hypothetical protein
MRRRGLGKAGDITNRSTRDGGINQRGKDKIEK